MGYQDVHDRIARAAESVGRDPAGITLVAVTKTRSVAEIRDLYNLGHRDFGESRYQEARPKIEELPSDIRWHFIGTLQSNKARRVAETFDVVHTLSSGGQLREIAKSPTPVDCLIEVNVAEEPQKSGLFAPELANFLREVLECHQVRFCGLMTIGPALDDPEAMRPYFRMLRGLNEDAGGKWLSMGMSHDFEIAVQEGATHVRVGTALFGER